MEKNEPKPRPGGVESIDPAKLEKAREQLEALGNYWIGPDIRMEKAVLMPPASVADHASVVVSKKDFPPIDLTREALVGLNWSTRSFLAQVGIELDYNGLDVTDGMIRDLEDGKEIMLPVWVRNHGSRPVSLEGRVMRFFWTNEAKRLRGDALRKSVNSDAFKIDGEGWSVDEKAHGIKIPLEHKYFIPSSDEVVRVSGKGDLPNILKEIPKGQNPDFKIGETARMQLGPDLAGVINWGMYEHGEIHTHSPLIDPGFQGVIRTETLRGLDFIELFLYKK